MSYKFFNFKNKKNEKRQNYQNFELKTIENKTKDSIQGKKKKKRKHNDAKTVALTARRYKIKWHEGFEISKILIWYINDFHRVESRSSNLTLGVEAAQWSCVSWQQTGSEGEGRNYSVQHYPGCGADVSLARANF